jgi:hypothetical protein
MPIFPKHFSKDEIKGLNDQLVLMLDLAREKAKIPFIISSGLRTQDQNIAINGVPDSAHLKGLAVDLKCVNGKDRFKMVFALLDVGFERIEIAPRHIHVDIDKTKPLKTMFLGVSN